MVYICTFSKHHVLIKIHCVLDSYSWCVKLAINPDGYIWAVSSFVTEYIQLCYLEETYLKAIVPPLMLFMLEIVLKAIELT